jgi:hypothetical protein
LLKSDSFAFIDGIEMSLVRCNYPIKRLRHKFGSMCGCHVPASL